MGEMRNFIFEFSGMRYRIKAESQINAEIAAYKFASRYFTPAWEMMPMDLKVYPESQPPIVLILYTIADVNAMLGIKSDIQSICQNCNEALAAPDTPYCETCRQELEGR